MSLVGIDIGTSAVKLAAYDEGGTLLSQARVPVKTIHPHPGWEEIDPEIMWQAVITGLCQLTSAETLKKDPPRGLAISASGDEVFLVNPKGSPLTPCILSGDVRGAEIEAETKVAYSSQEWYRLCGHVPERMDPVNRLLWWRKYHSNLFDQASQYLGWHEFTTLRLCGKAVTDPSLASKWLSYDLKANVWSPERLGKFGLKMECLPSVLPWGTKVGTILPHMVDQTGLEDDTVVCVGGFDSICSAIGSGVSEIGSIGLACGSWHVLVFPLPYQETNLNELERNNFSLTPYPSDASFSVIAQSPNGTSVLDWWNHLSALKNETDESLNGEKPSPILAIPHFSGAISCWENGRESRGTLIGLTLSTSQADIFQSLMESETYELRIAIQKFSSLGYKINQIRVSGGGSRSSWWMQLISDLSGLPVEVVDQVEPGTLGAAILAGVAIGTYSSVNEACKALTRVKRQYLPNHQRMNIYAERFELYKKAVKTCMQITRDLL